MFIGFCDFENDMCGWTNDDTFDVFDWLRSAGATPSQNTGPSVDHTTNSGIGKIPARNIFLKLLSKLVTLKES